MSALVQREASGYIRGWQVEVMGVGAAQRAHGAAAATSQAAHRGVGAVGDRAGALSPRRLVRGQRRHAPPHAPGVIAVGHRLRVGDHRRGRTVFDVRGIQAAVTAIGAEHDPATLDSSRQLIPDFVYRDQMIVFVVVRVDLDDGPQVRGQVS